MSPEESSILRPTASQTVGPFFGFALPSEDGPYVVPRGTEGAITVAGRLLDGAGDPVPDGIVEAWQADPDGHFDHPDDPRGAVTHASCRGFGRSETDPDGRFEFLTVKPGRLPGPAGSTQAPHIVISVFARGLLRRLVTRIYFGDEMAANESDPILSTLRLPEQRVRTLIAEPVDGGYRFDIKLQGIDETVFFSI